MQVDTRRLELLAEQGAAAAAFKASLGQLRYALTLQKARARKMRGGQPRGAQLVQSNAACASSPAHLSVAGSSKRRAAGDAAAQQSQHGGMHEEEPPAKRPSPAAPDHNAGQSDSDDECPVCAEPLVSDCMMGPCGHQWCHSCHKRLRALPLLKCPLCNTRIRAKDVAHVTMAAAQDDQDTSSSGQGLHGSKIGAVVTTVQRILFEQPADKVRSPDGLRVCSASFRWFQQRVFPLVLSSVVRLQSAVLSVLREATAILTNSCRAESPGHLSGVSAGPVLQVLVFSTWPDVLDVLHHALHMASVPHLRAKGKAGLANALTTFSTTQATPSLKQADVTPSLSATTAAVTCCAPRRKGAAAEAKRAAAAPAAPRVLLLLLSQAAAGLNLTSAQHVLLVEPSTNPATEAQVWCYHRYFCFCQLRVAIPSTPVL